MKCEVENEFNQVCEDMNDIGLTENGQWYFYLSNDELIYLGIDEKTIANQLAEEQELDDVSNEKEGTEYGI